MLTDPWPCHIPTLALHCPHLLCASKRLLPHSIQKHEGKPTPTPKNDVIVPVVFHSGHWTYARSVNIDQPCSHRKFEARWWFSCTKKQLGSKAKLCVVQKVQLRHYDFKYIHVHLTFVQSSQTMTYFSWILFVVSCFWKVPQSTPPSEHRLGESLKNRSGLFSRYLR